MPYALDGSWYATPDDPIPPWNDPTRMGEPGGTPVVPINQPIPPQPPIGPGTAPPDGRPAKQIMIERDREAWRNQLIQGALNAGFVGGDALVKADEELQQVERDVRNDNAPGGTDPSVFIAAAIARLRARGANNTGAPDTPTSPTTPGPSGFPTPSRATMPTPERSSVYTPAFKASMVQAPTEVGREGRDRILTAILERPETLDQRAQDSIFEQQKELANANAAAQRARLSQAVLAGGFTPVGGRALSGQAAIEETLGNTLLGARRDVAVKATEVNRRDQLAALEIQQAIASGDHTRALDIFKANEASRVQEEMFLAQAADLNSRNTIAHNDAMLRAAVAQQGGDMDYFQFLEMQRQFEAELKRRYYESALAGTR